MRIGEHSAGSSKRALARRIGQKRQTLKHSLDRDLERQYIARQMDWERVRSYIDESQE